MIFICGAFSVCYPLSIHLMRVIQEESNVKERERKRKYETNERNMEIE